MERDLESGKGNEMQEEIVDTPRTRNLFNSKVIKIICGLAIGMVGLMGFYDHHHAIPQIVHQDNEDIYKDQGTRHLQSANDNDNGNTPRIFIGLRFRGADGKLYQVTGAGSPFYWAREVGSDGQMIMTGEALEFRTN